MGYCPPPSAISSCGTLTPESRRAKQKLLRPTLQQQPIVRVPVFTCVCVCACERQRSQKKFLSIQQIALITVLSFFAYKFVHSFFRRFFFCSSNLMQNMRYFLFHNHEIIIIIKKKHIKLNFTHSFIYLFIMLVICRRRRRRSSPL